MDAVEHYFTTTPSSRPRPNRLQVDLLGRSFCFETEAGVFSKGRVDRGTCSLIASTEFPPEGRFLDWGCGYGAIGIVAAALTHLEVWMVDLNQRAVQQARRNSVLNHVPQVVVLCADGMSAFREGSFDLIASNPPIRAGNRVVFAFIEDASRILRKTGSLSLVAQTKQGAKSIALKMERVFGNVETVDRSGGYRVLRSLRT
ncbi:MAG: class I SAM-dependent methyltransferase [Armatimonadetes bacterium]|nr:class I SAM-dependent methyltransferase [Armatimonadota bacterium]